MNRSRTWTTAAIAFFCATGLFAQQKQLPPTPGTPRDFSVPQIRRFELPNGLAVRFVDYGNVPKATVRLVTQTGNLDESASEVWLANVTASMLEQGTATRGPEQIARLQTAPVDAATLGRARVKMRSSLYDEIEGLFGFGRADLLASFALFDDDPSKINRIEQEFARVTPELIQRTAQEYLRPTNRTVLTVVPKG